MRRRSRNHARTTFALPTQPPAVRVAERQIHDRRIVHGIDERPVAHGIHDRPIAHGIRERPVRHEISEDIVRPPHPGAKTIN